MANHVNENVFMYSWYLDAVSNNWGAVMDNEYKNVFPVTYTSKLGVKQFHQAMFTRHFDLIGDKLSMDKVLKLLGEEFKLVQFRSEVNFEGIQEREKRLFQSVNLKEDYESRYSKNAKRLIKKSSKAYTYVRVNCVDELISLVKTNVAHKIKEFTPENIEKLKTLMINGFENNKGETLAVLEAGEIVAAGFFLQDKSRVTYLKGASNQSAKKNGAMYGLMDFAFDLYKEDFSIFDFGGSNIANVALFYKKFGAVDNSYYNYTINDLPLWFNLLKKLKR